LRYGEGAELRSQAAECFGLFMSTHHCSPCARCEFSECLL